MKPQTLTTYITLPLSLISTVTLIWLFIRALLWPKQYSDFIFSTGFLIFIIEFFTIFTTAMISEVKKVSQSALSAAEKKNQYFRFVLVLLVILGMIAMMGFMDVKNYYLVVIFVLSLLSKITGLIAGQDVVNLKKDLALPILVLIPVIFLGALTGFIWEMIFPFGPEVWALKPANVEISGSIQGIFVAMILYYGILEYLNLSQLMGWHKDAWFNKMEIKEVNNYPQV